ncbi:MAG: type II toxin-antitoxin system VapC family toxin [Verrucomicrobiota bacterium]
MRFLLDTNVVSEAIRSLPNRNVLSWLAQNSVSSCLSAITVGEIWRGLELMKGKRKSQLQGWVAELESEFADRILPLDSSMMRGWGRYFAAQQRGGQRLSFADSLIGASALHFDLTLVTRNESDFPGVPVLNPWRQDR